MVHQNADLVNLIPYDLILNSAGVGLYGLNTKGNVTFFNHAASQMLGWNKADLTGKHMHRVLHHTKADGSPYPEEECPIYAALKDGTVHAIFHEVFWTKTGKPFPVEYISTPIRKRGEVVGVVVTFTDRLKCEVAREALRVFAENPRAATEFSEWCMERQKTKGA